MDLLSQAAEEQEHLQVAKELKNHNETMENGNRMEKETKAENPGASQQQKQQPENNGWHTVGIFKEPSANVDSFIRNSVWTSSEEMTAENLPDLSQFQRTQLEPGASYRFRIRAINALGVSEWSEISSFKTCMPGFPGAPSSIKISKTADGGAQLTWEPPSTCASTDEIIEYTVYLATKPEANKDGKAKATQLPFSKVYIGPHNYCTIAHSYLMTAHIDSTAKPAIIFRIAARNQKGYGPATQVRWLQDTAQNAGGARNPASLLSPKRNTSYEQFHGSPPNKRFK